MGGDEGSCVSEMSKNIDWTDPYFCDILADMSLPSPSTKELHACCLATHIGCNVFFGQRSRHEGVFISASQLDCTV